MDIKKQASDIFISTLKHVNPKEFFPEILSWNDTDRMLRIYDRVIHVQHDSRIFVIGTGKASPTMAAACEKILGRDLTDGMIIAPPHTEVKPHHITMLVGSHPLPDEKSFTASNELLEFIEKIPEDSVVINVLSGGTSSLLCVPAEGISIAAVRKVYNLLLESGASIHEVNTVRKTLSQVKGGLLLNRLKHTTLLDLVISDVPDDDLRYIGSGPTTAQEISFTDAKEIAEKYDIWRRFPESVKNHIQKNLKKGELKVTEDFKNHQAWIVSSALTVAKKTKLLLEENGYETELIQPAWTGLIDDFEEKIIEIIHDHILNSTRKKALVFYGECTVKVTGKGLGGRNQELALRLARQLNDTGQHVAFLSAGTDGIDGPTDVAGAVVDQNTWSKATEKKLDPETFIRNNDSYHFFREAGGHIVTGPTGNNVMDIQIVLTV
jgi:glycerate 2-kinase